VKAREEIHRREREAAAPERPPDIPPILQLQRTAGNQAVTRALQVARAPDFWGKVTKAIVGSYQISVGAERVWVADEKQEAEAARIITDIKANYGVEISSLKSVEAVRKHYDAPPEAVRKSVKTDTWEFRELVALERALAHFAPILGEKRSHSTRKDADQEVTSAGKGEQSITKNTAAGTLDPDTLGEFFKESKNFTTFEPGETSTIDFPGDNAKQLEATAVHEIAHGLMKYAIGEFMAATEFWTDEDTKSGKAGAEAPPTPYGNKNAREDLSESVMMYFVEPKRLSDPCPKRFAVLDKIVLAWTPVGDYELPRDKSTAYA
jgi:hypothetical protein